MAIVKDSKIRFLLGTSEKLKDTAIKDGVFYLTTDEHRLYIGDNSKAILLNEQVIFVNTLADLPTKGEPKQIAYVKEGYLLCIWDDAKTGGAGWVQINPDTRLTPSTDAVSVSRGSADKTAIIKTAVKDSNNNTVFGSFDIVGGSGIGVTTSGNTITLTSTGVGGTKINFDAEAEGNNAKLKQITIGLDSDGNEVAATKQIDFVSIKGGTNITSIAATPDTEGGTGATLTVNAADQGVTEFAAQNEDKGFKIALTQSATSKTFGQKTATINPTIKIDGETEPIYFAQGQADLRSLATQTYVNNQIAKNNKAIDALQFKGVIGVAGGATLEDINSGKVKAGYTYKVGGVDNTIRAAFPEARVGDLIIATTDAQSTEDDDGFITAGGSYVLIPSGDDLQYNITATADGFALTDLNSGKHGEVSVSGEQDVEVSMANNNSSKQTITVKHSEKTVTQTVATEGPTYSNNKLAVNVITKVEADSTGHVKEVTTTPVSIKDTTYKVAGNVAAANNTVTSTLVLTNLDTNGQENVKTDFTSETLTISATAGSEATNPTIKMDMVWDEF